MHDRTALGPADVSTDELTRMVAALHGVAADEVTVLDSCAEEVAYDLPAITTAGRYWVRGQAGVRGRPEPFGFFVKHVQSWARSPLFTEVPEAYREQAAASVPWRTEPLAYRSDLATRLPEGLSMPRALGVFDLDELSASIWLEEVPAGDAEWDLDLFTRAAYLLGRLAASTRVGELARVGQHPWTVADYLNGRLNLQVLPMLRDRGIWQHPLVARAFDAVLHERLLDAADRAEALVEELAALPHLTGHGDACPNNLLVQPGSEDFVLIDYGFWGVLPVGFDLSQLLVGDVQVGRRAAATLPETEAACLPAYVAGLRAEGSDVPGSAVRRAHALQLLIFTGLSTLPFEHLGEVPTTELQLIASDRAEIARFSLDLVDATG
jgi:hypothetical protein